jgi:hypothetical protein
VFCLHNNIVYASWKFFGVQARLVWAGLGVCLVSNSGSPSPPKKIQQFRLPRPHQAYNVEQVKKKPVQSAAISPLPDREYVGSRFFPRRLDIYYLQAV